MSSSISDWLRQAKQQLAAVTGEVDAEAKYCCSFVLQQSNTYLYSHGDQLLSAAQWQQLQAILQRRLTGEPLAYILGQWHFWDFELEVAPSTLIPRADTEILVEKALTLLEPTPARIIDLGTGTGAIALALAKERPDCQVIGLDIQPAAVALATRNAKRLNLENCRFVQSDWFAALSGSEQGFDLIVSNPPYIDASDPHLTRGDVRFEPGSALVSDDAGFADIQQIIRQSTDFLHQGGWLLMEHGYQQADEVTARLNQGGFSQVASEKDYGGQWRISFGQWLCKG
ncbi:MAG: peptide chain release factor N(5)-glutamine methyltransferase [Alkalimonas sp.]|nr:peptide chain release factor N(5)-glutamine methyltransferase [Alkalimonas sp.]